MSKHIVYVIRYSILQHAKAWHLAREHDFATYRSKLFDPARLRLKRALFEQVTLPSLVAQQAAGQVDSRTILILVSPELPADERAALERLVAPVSDAVLLDISAEERVPDKVESYLMQRFASPGEHLVGTVRLDDDDALVASFEQQLAGYLNAEHCNKAITFSKGYELLVSSDNSSSTLQALEAQYLSLPKIALGLSYIAQITDGQTTTKFSNIFQLGNHDEVQRATEVVKDTSQRNYIRVAYKEQDTEARGFLNRKSKGAKGASLTDLKHQFPAIKML